MPCKRFKKWNSIGGDDIVDKGDVVTGIITHIAFLPPFILWSGDYRAILSQVKYLFVSFFLHR